MASTAAPVASKTPAAPVAATVAPVAATAAAAKTETSSAVEAATKAAEAATRAAESARKAADAAKKAAEDAPARRPRPTATRNPAKRTAPSAQLSKGRPGSKHSKGGAYGSALFSLPSVTLVRPQRDPDGRELVRAVLGRKRTGTLRVFALLVGTVAVGHLEITPVQGCLRLTRVVQEGVAHWKDLPAEFCGPLRRSFEHVEVSHPSPKVYKPPAVHSCYEVIGRDCSLEGARGQPHPSC